MSMHVMQGDIRGQQLENRRILDTLVNQQNGNQLEIAHRLSELYFKE